MSGGHFDYKQHHITDIAEEIEQLIFTNGDITVNEYGDRLGRGYSPETIKEFQTGLELCRKAAIYAHRIDWLVSSDDGEESFHEYLKHDLK